MRFKLQITITILTVILFQLPLRFRVICNFGQMQRFTMLSDQMRSYNSAVF